MVNIQNGIITMNRGDTFYMPLYINIGSKIDKKYYVPKDDNDKIYFAVEEYNQPFEHALIRKVFDYTNVEDDHIVLELTSDDTRLVLPGEYYYEIKFCHKIDEEHEFIDTIVPRRKFIILE